MPALKARPYEPPPSELPGRDFWPIVDRILKGDPPGWEEVRSGDRGFDVTRCRWNALRDLTTVSDPGGGYLKKSSQPATFFNAMLVASAIAKAAAKNDEPKGDWSAIPTVATVGELAWVSADGGTITETPMTFGSRARRARLGVFSVTFSRNLRVTTGGLTERLILSEGARVVAAGIDKAALQGTGVDDEPLGILSAPIADTSGATFSTTTAAELLRILEDVNANPTAFMVSPTTAKLLRTRQRFTGTDTPLLSGGRMSDLPVFVTNSMPDGKVLCGDFSRLTICNESVQILVNPYVNSTTGKTTITFYLFADIVLEHASAFVVATEVS
jgi:hypothetical protein